MRKCQCLLFVLKQSYICYYTICMTVPLIDLMTTIYFTNHRKIQLLNFLKKYSCIIYVKNYLECEFEKFAF